MKTTSLGTEEIKLIVEYRNHPGRFHTVGPHGKPPPLIDDFWSPARTDLAKAERYLLDAIADGKCKPRNGEVKRLRKAAEDAITHVVEEFKENKNNWMLEEYVKDADAKRIQSLQDIYDLAGGNKTKSLQWIFQNW